MTLETDKIHNEYVELKSRRSSSSIILIGLTMAAVVVGISVIPALTSSLTHSLPASKHALCTARVLGLAQNGIIRDIGGYYGALSECMAMKHAGSIYSGAGAA